MSQRLETETELKNQEQETVKRQELQDMVTEKGLGRKLRRAQAAQGTSQLEREAKLLDSNIAIEVDQNFANLRHSISKLQNEDNLVHYKALEQLGVDLTRYLVSQQRSSGKDI